MKPNTKPNILPGQPELHESRFWVVARKGKAHPLPYGWSNVRWVALLLARVVCRCGLEAVRVIERDEGVGHQTIWRA